jgi:hypothetical protein
MKGFSLPNENEHTMSFHSGFKNAIIYGATSKQWLREPSIKHQEISQKLYILQYTTCRCQWIMVQGTEQGTYSMVLGGFCWTPSKKELTRLLTWTGWDRLNPKVCRTRTLLCCKRYLRVNRATPHRLSTSMPYVIQIFTKVVVTRQSKVCRTRTASKHRAGFADVHDLVQHMCKCTFMQGMWKSWICWPTWPQRPHAVSMPHQNWSDNPSDAVVSYHHS